MAFAWKPYHLERYTTWYFRQLTSFDQEDLWSGPEIDLVPANFTEGVFFPHSVVQGYSGGRRFVLGRPSVDA